MPRLKYFRAHPQCLHSLWHSRDFPDALEEGSDAALASSLKVIERIFTAKSPEGCGLSIRANAEEQSTDDPHPVSFTDYASCVETLLAVVDATREIPGTSAASCLWWLSGANEVVSNRALAALLAAAARGVETEVGNGTEQTTQRIFCNAWSWLPRGSNKGEERGCVEEKALSVPRPLEAAQYLAALCLCKPGLQCLEAGVERDSSIAVEALVQLCGSTDSKMACACFRILQALARGGIGAQAFVDAGALKLAVEAGVRFEVAVDEDIVDDDKVRAVASALGAFAELAKAVKNTTLPLVDDAFQVSVRCLRRLGEFSGRPTAAAVRAALDVVTFRLTRPDRPTGITSVPVSRENSPVKPVRDDGDDDSDDRTGAESTVHGVDTPMEILRDASDILTAMKVHPTDSRVQQSGWRALIAIDTGRGDLEKFLKSGGDEDQSRHQMLKDCLERHGGGKLVAGQVAEILEGLKLEGDSGERLDLRIYGDKFC